MRPGCLCFRPQLCAVLLLLYVLLSVVPEVRGTCCRAPQEAVTAPAAIRVEAQSTIVAVIFVVAPTVVLPCKSWATGAHADQRKCTTVAPSKPRAAVVTKTVAAVWVCRCSSSVNVCVLPWYSICPRPCKLLQEHLCPQAPLQAVLLYLPSLQLNSLPKQQQLGCTCGAAVHPDTLSLVASFSPRRPSRVARPLPPCSSSCTQPSLFVTGPPRPAPLAMPLALLPPSALPFALTPLLLPRPPLSSASCPLLAPARNNRRRRG